MLTPAVRSDARNLAAHELPCYVHDLTDLHTHAAAVRTALPPEVELYYAAKANPDPRILATLAPWTDGFEVSSGGELAHVRAAVPGRPLAFSGPGKTPAELAEALASGVERVHAESLHEVRMLRALAAHTPVPGRPPTRVLVRINPPVPDGTLTGSALTMGGRPAPFGMGPEEASEALRLLTDGDCPGLEAAGVHAHLASGLPAGALLCVAEAVVAAATALARCHGTALDEVVLGGGMGVDYTSPADRFDWAAYGAGLASLVARHPGLRLRIEPGRALTAYCGWYVTEVLDVKRSHGQDVAVVRGGTHHLRTPAAKGHDQPAEVVPVEAWPHPWPRPAAKGGRVTVAGQLCTPKDVLTSGLVAPGLRAGDRVVFALAGAYAWNISHRDFLMHPPPGFRFLGGPGTRTSGGC
ncbi:type III PLP-dependent enzyme [Streptomyces sp. ITFR-16]|nr:type III PLP-dependent enzyme [Streptomyces sp. ITFR-16]WNI27137.1 type III PLP-dependent enzyme [Streptomyces sp. ITFR-16]